MDDEKHISAMREQQAERAKQLALELAGHLEAGAVLSDDVKILLVSALSKSAEGQKDSLEILPEVESVWEKAYGKKWGSPEFIATIDRMATKLVQGELLELVIQTKKPGARDDFGSYGLKHQKRLDLRALSEQIFDRLPVALKDVSRSDPYKHTDTTNRGEISVFENPSDPNSSVVFAEVYADASDRLGRPGWGGSRIFMIIKNDSEALVEARRGQFGGLLRAVFHAGMALDSKSVRLFKVIYPWKHYNLFDFSTKSIIEYDDLTAGAHKMSLYEREEEFVEAAKDLGRTSGRITVVQPENNNELSNWVNTGL